MHTTSAESLVDKMLHSGINVNELKKIKKDLKSWISSFSNPKDNIIQSVNNIIHNPLIPKNVLVHGMIIDPITGKVDILINNYN